VDERNKIGAIGVRIRHWVTMHGVSLNLDPDLEHFAGIVPCGVNGPGFGVTSLPRSGYPGLDGRARHGAQGRVHARSSATVELSRGPLLETDRRLLGGGLAGDAGDRPGAGPCGRPAIISSMAAGSPAKRASTLPSWRLRTSRAGHAGPPAPTVRSDNQTPWTLPRMRPAAPSFEFEDRLIDPPGCRPGRMELADLAVAFGAQQVFPSSSPRPPPAPAPP